jgi:hypothetical protein
MNQALYICVSFNSIMSNPCISVYYPQRLPSDEEEHITEVYMPVSMYLSYYTAEPAIQLLKYTQYI